MRKTLIALALFALSTITLAKDVDGSTMKIVGFMYAPNGDLTTLFDQSMECEDSLLITRGKPRSGVSPKRGCYRISPDLKKIAIRWSETDFQMADMDDFNAPPNRP